VPSGRYWWNRFSVVAARKRLSSAAAAGYRLWWKFPECPMYVSGDPATAVVGYGVVYMLLRLE
jgi:hypothetical protein